MSFDIKMSQYDRKLKLKYGNAYIDVNLRSDSIFKIIPSPLLDTGQIDPKAIISSTVESCSERFRLFRPEDRVMIVTSDITRYTGSEIYLPILVEKLNSIGIKDENVEILIALGIHRKQTEHEHEKILGSIYGRINVTDHDCDDQDSLVILGRTSGGIDVEVNRKVVDADQLILTGSIGYHYFAGFSGGRKSILPGVASRKSCMASHFAVLNPGEGSGKNPLATVGSLEENPVNRAMMEACSMVDPDLLLNTVVNPDKKIAAVFMGDWRQAHSDGCRYYYEKFSAPIRGKADLVIVSCGGYPKDINFIQSHKSMEYGSRALKDRGVMILLAQCLDGYGHPGFFKWFRFTCLDDLEAELRMNYEINGQTAYSVMQKSKRFKIILVSDLPRDEVNSMGIAPASSLDEAIEMAESILNKVYRCYIIPEGSLSLPVITDHPHSG